ncbi:MAG TPA: hypothetical protein VF719_08865 [Abditibacteriaceae bacterium]|jgi:hypothetical protein
MKFFFTVTRDLSAFEIVDFNPEYHNAQYFICLRKIPDDITEQLRAQVLTDLRHAGKTPRDKIVGDVYDLRNFQSIPEIVTPTKDELIECLIRFPSSQDLTTQSPLERKDAAIFHLAHCIDETLISGKQDAEGRYLLRFDDVYL